jgi:sporulation protein YlmC with PRC-barrel domain
LNRFFETTVINNAAFPSEEIQNPEDERGQNMNISEHVIKQSELPGRLILDYNTTDILGRLSRLWLDVKTHAVIGLACKKKFLSRHEAVVPWSCVKTIGKDSIVVNVEGVDTHIEKSESVVPIIEHDVWTDEGSKVGHIIDFLLDTETGKVVSYLFTANGWSGMMKGDYHLPPEAIASVGDKRLIAHVDIIRNSEKYEAGLGEKLSSAQETAKVDLEKARRNLSTLTHHGQAFAERLKEKTQSLAGQWKDKLSHGRHSSKKESSLPEVELPETTAKNG